MKLNYRRVLFVSLAFFLIQMFWQCYDSIIPKILTDKFGMVQWLSGAVMALDNVLALFLLPPFVSKTFQVELPSLLEKIVLIFIFAAEILGEIGGYYDLDSEIVQNQIVEHGER